MNGERLDEIEARAEAATPGPWEIIHYTEDDGTDGRFVQFEKPKPGQHFGVDSTVLPETDAEFIANSRQDVPDLIAEVRRLRWKMIAMGQSYIDDFGRCYFCDSKDGAPHEDICEFRFLTGDEVVARS